MHVTAPEAVAVEVAVLLLATNVYRAWTQSIGLDEARSYNMLSAARGYGLGLGLPMWAFTHLALYFEDQDEGRLFKAGIVPAFELATLAAGAIAARQWARSRLFAGFERADRALLLLGGTMALALLMIVAARHLAGVLYPSGRMRIYWAPLTTLAERP